MSGEESVAEEMEVEETGSKDAKQERERSSIIFPYLDLDTAVEVARAVHAVGGSSCQWDQLAAHLGQAGNGGSFRLRVVSARIFGLATAASQTVTLTPLGARIADPQQEKAARVEAFLRVPLYKAIYEQFKNGVLPPTAGLENAMVTHGVAAKQKDKARQAFQRSAAQAGFFSYGNTKLVLPVVNGSATVQPRVAAPTAEPTEKQVTSGGFGKGGGSDGNGLHPFIQGLLATLPEPHSDWSLEGRKKWLNSALSIFDLIYDGADEGQSIAIMINRGSAN